MMFDLSSVTPQARPILQAAAHDYYQHTQPWFIGLIAHGSAVKGGFIIYRAYPWCIYHSGWLTTNSRGTFPTIAAVSTNDTGKTQSFMTLFR